jgi:hypothetical protein
MISLLGYSEAQKCSKAAKIWDAGASALKDLHHARSIFPTLVAVLAGL